VISKGDLTMMIEIGAKVIEPNVMDVMGCGSGSWVSHGTMVILQKVMS
jgi:hypothetical protein